MFRYSLVDQRVPASDVPQPGGDEIESRDAVGESTNDTGPPSDLAHDAFERIVGADASPMLFREGVVPFRWRSLNGSCRRCP